MPLAPISQKPVSAQKRPVPEIFDDKSAEQTPFKRPVPNAVSRNYIPYTIPEYRIMYLDYFPPRIIPPSNGGNEK